LSRKLLPLGPGWEDVLRPVLETTGGRVDSAAARLLYDLQAASHELETTPHRVDVVEWALSLGRRPVRRPLESLREVAALRRVRRAERRIDAARLAGPDRERLTEQIERAEHRLEERIRSRLRPILDDGIAGSGLRLDSFVERVAARKLAEELADRTIERGFFTFSELRDAVARNQAKLSDLSGPREFLLGDPILRMDRAFAVPLEGVYRRGEFYLRGLQRASSLAFGTAVGRFLTRFGVLPFLGAFVVLEGLQHLLSPPVETLAGVRVHLLTPLSFVSLGLFLLGLLTVADFRRGVVSLLRGCGNVLRGVFVEAPRWVLGLGLVRRVRDSRPWRWSARFVLVPALAAAVLSSPLFWVLPRGTVWILAAGLFLGIDVLLNSPLGAETRERVADWGLSGWRQVIHGLVPATLRLVLDLFRRAIDLLESGLYRVDEVLRFRPGEGALSVFLKGAGGLLWFAVAYVARIYITLLVEPQVNPIKHFPVVTVSHKIILPLSPTLLGAMRAPLLPLGSLVANAVAGVTVFLLPGVFGFLVWELKENWRLYRANRPRRLEPVVVGSHGETLPRLLRPGFHSGTVPKLFAKLRRALRENRRSVAKLEIALHHVEESAARFVERECLALVGGLSVGQIRLSPNRIAVEIREGERAFWIAFEEREGRLLARAPEVSERLREALAGLWRLAGADLCAEDLEKSLGTTDYDVSAAGIVVWRQETESVISFRGLLLADRPILWEEWVRAWKGTQIG